MSYCYRASLGLLLRNYWHLYKKSNYSCISHKHIQVDDVIYILFLFLYYYRYIKRRFHLVMHLFSNRSQKISKSGKNISDKPTYRLTCILMSSVVNTWTDAQQHGVYLLNIYTGLHNHRSSDSCKWMKHCTCKSADFHVTFQVKFQVKCLQAGLLRMFTHPYCACKLMPRRGWARAR